MNYIGNTILRKFYNQTLYRMHLSALTGFIIGIKLCDYLFYNEQPFNELKEDMEDEFWAHHGEPTEIQPYMVPTCKEGKENQLRKSWIYIMYEKDQIIKKKDDFD